MLIYVNFNNEFPKNKKVIRKCKTNGCLNYAHMCSGKQEIDFDKIWQRLLKNSEKNEETGCLLWKKYINADGYGVTSFDGQTRYVHNVSYQILTKSLIIPRIDKNGNSLEISHSCNYKNCFAHEHLELKTKSENNYEDKIKSGTITRGSKNKSAKITEELAKQIKHSRYDKTHELYKTDSQRASIYNVSESIIHNIDSGISWGWIPDRDGKTIDSRIKNKRKSKCIKPIWTPEFLSKVKEKIKNNSTEDEHGCWIWNLTKDNCGYGRISVDGYQNQVHIVSCEAKYGRSTIKGQVVRHMCNQPACTNPNHLEFGSPKDNALDTLKSGRNKSALDKDVVLEIRRTYEKDGLNQTQRAIKYGISRLNLRKIEKGITHKHLL